MSNQRPQRVIIAYGDSSTKEIEFAKLSRVAQAELLRLANSPILSRLPHLPQKYLLLEWKDGCQEVAGIEKHCSEILRYYVIQRPEETGRLAIECPGTYPEFRIIERHPRQLEKVSIIDGKNRKMHSLAQDRVAREGDKTEYHYKLNKVDEDSVKEIVSALKKVLKRNGIRADEVLAMNDTQRTEEYEKIRREIGLRAYEKEGEALGFLQMMLETIAKDNGASET
jgi:hypothetical protein